MQVSIRSNALQRNLACAVAMLAGSLLAIPGQLLSQEVQAESSTALTDKEKEEFLLNAEVVKRRGIPVGVTQSKRLTLSDGRLTHDAQFQYVNVRKASYETPMGREINFRDYFAYNIAAYRLDRLINLNMVPVSVQRSIARTTGAVTWWVDDVQMMEKDRYLKKIKPPDQARWNYQMYQLRVFNELVYNTDANLGNLLIDGDWNIRAVDFTRAFRLYKRLRNPKNLTRIDRRVYEDLGSLSEEVLMRELRPYLSKYEINGILARRDLIVKFFDEKIAQQGEAAVFIDEPGQ